MERVAGGERAGESGRAVRDVVDMASVPHSQLAMHDRLENWARWCDGSGRGGSVMQPMFRLYRPSGAWGREASGVVIDAMDAQRLQKAVVALPEPHRIAISWWYNEGTQPLRVARRLAVSVAGLKRLVDDGRLMLINRKA